MEIWSIQRTVIVKESMMGLRLRQGNLRQVVRFFKSHPRLCRGWDSNNLKTSLRFPC